MSVQLHVLVVDDSEAERAATVALLMKEEYRVSNAESVADARHKLRMFNSRNELDSIRVVVLESDLRREEDPIQNFLPINYLAAKVKVILLNRNGISPKRRDDALNRGVDAILHKENSLPLLVPNIKALFE